MPSYAQIYVYTCIGEQLLIHKHTNIKTLKNSGTHKHKHPSIPKPTTQKNNHINLFILLNALNMKPRVTVTTI